MCEEALENLKPLKEEHKQEKRGHKYTPVADAAEEN